MQNDMFTQTISKLKRHPTKFALQLMLVLKQKVKLDYSTNQAIELMSIFVNKKEPIAHILKLE